MAIYRVYAVRNATIAGKVERVIGEQIGPNYSTKQAAENAAKQQNVPYKIVHVGGLVHEYGRNGQNTGSYDRYHDAKGNDLTLAEAARTECN